MIEVALNGLEANQLSDLCYYMGMVELSVLTVEQFYAEFHQIIF